MNITISIPALDRLCSILERGIDINQLTTGIHTPLDPAPTPTPKIKKEKVREILQKLKYSKMYDHVQQIKNRIQQQMTSLTLSKEVEEKLQHMFKEIQPAFI